MFAPLRSRRNFLLRKSWINSVSAFSNQSRNPYEYVYDVNCRRVIKKKNNIFARYNSKWSPIESRIEIEALKYNCWRERKFGRIGSNLNNNKILKWLSDVSQEWKAANYPFEKRCFWNYVLKTGLASYFFHNFVPSKHLSINH